MCINILFPFPICSCLENIDPSMTMFLAQQYRFCIPVITNRYLVISGTTRLEKRFVSTARGKFFDEHEVTINTCGKLYEKWSKERKFRTLPKGDLNFKVKYIDTHKDPIENSSHSCPVVVALHGAPGSYSDFTHLASYLQSKGSRVVIPSFPDYSVYPPGVFRHSAEEKAEFIKDFLTAISINQVDTLLVHSSGVYPGMLLCLDQVPQIKSMVMLNPGTFSYTMKATKHINVLRMLTVSSEIPSILAILQRIGPLILKISRAPVRIENFLDPLLSAASMVYAGIPKAKNRYRNLINRGFPLLYAFSNDDKLIGKETSYDLAHLLGACDSDIFVYDKDGNLIQNGKESSTLKVMSFEKGSHYVFWKHADIVFAAIADFITNLQQKNS